MRVRTPPQINLTRDSPELAYQHTIALAAQRLELLRRVLSSLHCRVALAARCGQRALQPFEFAVALFEHALQALERRLDQCEALLCTAVVVGALRLRLRRHRRLGRRGALQ